MHYTPSSPGSPGSQMRGTVHSGFTRGIATIGVVQQMPLTIWRVVTGVDRTSPAHPTEHKYGKNRNGRGSHPNHKRRPNAWALTCARVLPGGSVRGGSLASYVGIEGAIVCLVDC